MECGFSPRALFRLNDLQLLFVGCKDGSIWVVEGAPEDSSARIHLLQDGRAPDGSSPQLAGVRAICPAWREDLLLVGRSDGRIDALRWEQLPGSTGEASRFSGSLALICRTGELKNLAPGPQERGVRYFSRLDNHRWAFLSTGLGGTLIVDLQRPIRVGAEDKERAEKFENKELFRRLASGSLLRSSRAPVTNLRMACRVHSWDWEGADLPPPSESWLLVTEQGEFLTWPGPPKVNGPVPKAVLRRSPWSPGERPKFVNDYALWGEPGRTENGRPFRGVFLATDRGVFLVASKVSPGKGSHQILQPLRQSLPGLGLMATALTYAELPGAERSAEALQFLWVVDSRGNCHLFCDRPQDRRQGRPAAHRLLPNFRSTGFSHIGNQAVLAYSWPHATERRGTTLSFAYARQDYRIGLGSYKDPREALPARPAAEPVPFDFVREARRHLGGRNTCISCLQVLLRQAAIASSAGKMPGGGPRASEPAPLMEEIFADFLEFLAESPGTRDVLKDFLNNPSATNSASFLATGRWYRCEPHKHLADSDARLSISRVQRSCRALDLWTLALLGIVQRFFDPLEVERYSLGILRWLEDSRRRFTTEARSWKGANRDRVLARYNDCARMIRKWGLFEEANARRPGLLRPIETLQRQKLDGQKLDQLSYEALLHYRSVDLLCEQREGEMEGRSSWDVSSLTFSEDGAPPVPPFRRWLAVSWRWGGVELLELEPGKAKGSDGPTLRRLAAVVASKQSHSEPEIYEAPLHSVRAPAPDSHELQDRSKYGFSRGALLTGHENRHYLLLSIAQDPDLQPSGRSEQICVYRLDTRPDVSPEQRASKLDQGFELPAGESVYSFLDLGGGLVLAGLRGRGGAPKLMLLHLGAFLSGGTAEPRSEIVEIRDKRLGAQASKQNRIWCLAKPWYPGSAPGGPASADPIEIVVGCGGGEIWRLSWPRSGAFQTELFSRENDQGYELTPVFRMSSRVLSLAFRVLGQGGPSRTERIFAGSSDGSILAFQRLGAAAAGENAGENEPVYASLWATWERGGPIEALHFVNPPATLMQPDEGGYPPPDTYIVATTRGGHSIFFDDRSQVPKPPPGSRPEGSRHRIPFAGCRHGRYSLTHKRSEAGQEAFAALVFAEGEIDGGLPGQDLNRCCPCPDLSGACDHSPDAFGRVAVLLTASGFGTLRLQGLHLPDFTPARRRAFRRLEERWWEVCRNKEGIPQLHLGEAGFHASSAVSLTFVRWLLEHRPEDFQGRANEWFGTVAGSPSSKSQERRLTDQFPRRWQVPRNFRPLLDLRRAWHRGDHDEVRDCLETALRTARRLRDLDLYQEISEGVLREANRLVFRASESDDRHLHDVAEKLYGVVFQVIDRSLEEWQGRPHREESRARICVAKNLVDGFTFLAVLDRAFRESSEGLPDGPFRRVLDRRISGVRQLVFKRDPLVSLEALRAVNLALMRLCRILVLRSRRSRRKSPKRRAAWRRLPLSAEGPSAEIRWKELSGYFEELLYSAAQAFRTPAELSDAVLHEYSRGFALLVCACPPAAYRIASRMGETRLVTELEDPQSLSRRVARQLRLLESIGLPTPPQPAALFRLALAGPGVEGSAFPLRQVFRRLKSREIPLSIWRSLSTENLERISDVTGLENARDLMSIAQVERVHSWFEDLTKSLATDVQAIYRSLGRRRELGKALRTLGRASLLEISSSPEAARRRPHLQQGIVRGQLIKGGLFEETFLFLEAALRNSPASIPRLASSPHRGPIRPDLILWIRDLSSWAERQERELERRFQRMQIFEPERSLFHHLLHSFRVNATEFRKSAVVQKAVVGGVLGHHLLEELDEHVLELEEIAENLDPVEVSRFRREGRRFQNRASRVRGPAVAERFASHLLHRSHRVSSIPKNLRSLYAILMPSEDVKAPEPDKRSDLTLKDLIERYRGRHWDTAAIDRVPGDSLERLTHRVAMHLELILVELHQNHLRYSSRASPDVARKLRPRVEVLADGKLDLLFHFEPDAEHEKRLNDVIECEAQQPIVPARGRSEASSGTGLYLANLAAAVVEWRLEVRLDEDEEEGSGLRRFHVILEKLSEEGSR